MRMCPVILLSHPAASTHVIHIYRSSVAELPFAYLCIYLLLLSRSLLQGQLLFSPAGPGFLLFLPDNVLIRAAVSSARGV